ncbi:FMN-dependent NADH-azoreductase [Kribbella aluminosa]|uniref:FMN dependent NADH:quinone oxidoreductase n=1 Tax=Kribbella aluminosa TaxID=416017 RepID=A0ABS4UIY7_9ACTN|nr:NAD(P)H-dependent oxidoreductase [Kribbella aluminosa]MBP2351521.1 FMN-dependent NADH-azoreductase [Kribbella aluminosa]
MSTLLHIASSPRGNKSESLRIADTFVDVYRETHPGDEVVTWNLWDGTLPEFGPAAAGAKMTFIAGEALEGEEAEAWEAVQATVQRFLAADRLLFSVPMWNAGVPYILKQFIDVISQPGTIWGLDPHTGYQPLLAGTGRKAAVIYTSGVWGPQLGPSFGTNFQSTFFNDWLRWTGIDDITDIRYHPTLTGDAPQSRDEALSTTRTTAKTF